MELLRLIITFLAALVRSRAQLALEHLALRQQLAILKRERPRPRLKLRDRLFWVALSRWFGGWRSCLLLVRPETVCRWHRQAFRSFWRWKSRRGRPRIDRELRDLIGRLAVENPLWGVPRIRAELKLLGYRVCQATIRKYLAAAPRGPRKPTSQSWRTFWKNHPTNLAAIDFFVVPTVRFSLLYVFLVLSPDRRRVVHFGVTANPSAQWTANQLVEAFPYDTAPKYLVRDNDGIYGEVFRKRMKALNIEEVPISPRSPWQNPYVERLIGTIRRELLNHVIVLSEAHLKRLLTEFFRYYHEARTHMALDDNAPIPRDVEPPERGKVVCTPYLGGLHHRYSRAA
ncbi:MAG: integrase core domain-containing protein [Planctomycetia bacterium]|nr:integrase core domain-containing protein [Planctomycetia bacterium]